MATGISFGHFNIVGGAVREDGPYVAVLEDRNPAESLADLYVVVEPVESAEQRSEEFCADLLTLAERHFGHPQYSLTGNLLQALRAMQEHLRAWNKGAAPAERVSAGCTCLAVSGDEAYLAQVGPGVAYIRHDGRLQRLEPVEPESQAPLGTTIACSPSFSRFQLVQGDTLLLSSSRFSALASDAHTDQILALPPGEALPEIYRVARDEAEFSALYLAVTGDLRPAESEHAAAVSDEPAHRSGTGTTTASGRRPAPPQRSADAAYERFTEEHAEQTYEMQDAAAPFGAIEAAPELDAETRRRHLQRLNERHSLALPKPAVYTVVAVLILGLAGWLGLPRLLQTGTTDRFTSLLAGARTAEQAAASAQGPEQKRALLGKAQADLDQAKLMRPQAPELASLEAQTANALNGLNAVQPLPSPRSLLDLTTTQILPSSVTDFVAGSQLYLLDASTGTVYGIQPGAQPVQATAIFESGKLIENIAAGPAQHLAWQPPAEGKPGLLYILDRNHRLFSYDSAGTLRNVGLTGVNQWKSVAGIAAASGDLYVLDSGGNQIWRYTLAANGFTDAPTPLLAKIDLHDATQIGASGDIYVGTQGGRLLRFNGGNEQEVKISGIDSPLLSPEVPLLDPSTGLLYIADPGNQRIVVADANDVYRRQYAGSSLRGLRAIALDAGSGILYTLSEQSLIASQIR